jgi:hypothetical protein
MWPKYALFSLSLVVLYYRSVVKSAMWKLWTGGGDVPNAFDTAPISIRGEEEKPNYFITFHIKNEKLVSNISAIGEDLLSLDPNFAEFIQPLPSLHVTTILVHLNQSNFNR